MLQIKAEGEKVANGDAIFRYYNSNEDNLVNKIEELDVKIQEAMDNETEIYSSDIKLLEEQIQTELNQLVKQNNVQKIQELKKEINNKITKKAKIAGERSPSGSYIRKLIEERSSYEYNLNSGSEYVNAPKSGIVSYRVDGLENVLTFESFSTLNKQFLENLNLKTGEVVATSNENGKVINNFECYIATSLKSDQAKAAKVGQSVKIRLSTSEEITAKIEYIIEEDESRLVIFKITNGVELLTSYRKITLDVVWWSHEGLKVPNSALTKETITNKNTNEEKDVYSIIRNRMGYTDKIYVKVLKQNETYSIITNYDTEELKENLGYNVDEVKQAKTIVMHDEIVINPKK